MLTASRALGLVLLVKAVDVAERGPQELATAVWALVLAGWAAGAVGLLCGLSGRTTWSLVAVCGVGFAVDFPPDLRRQHLVLLVGLALAALVAGDEREQLLLWRTQLTALYGFAVLSKLNESFLTGNVVARDVAEAPFWSGLLPVPGTAALVALSALLVLVELALAVGLWLPAWRRRGLVLALAFHGGALLLVGITPLVSLRLVVFGGAAVVAYAACAGVLPLGRVRTSVGA